MTTAVSIKPDFDVSRLVIDGDLSRLVPEQKSQYYILRCKEHGLNPSSQPFNYLKLNGKEVLYANKGCAEQLRAINKVSIKITKADKVDEIFVVIAEAKDGNGREDSATGAVPIMGLKGEALANAMMKAETKAKRRVTLSICGMNMLDETEVESITGPNRPWMDQPTAEEGHNVTPEYCVPYGPLATKPISECDPVRLRNFIHEREEAYRKSGRKPGAWFIELLKHAEPLIAEFENGASQ